MTASPYQMPIAIVGMACRFPNSDNLESYWDLLINGRSAIQEVPAERADLSLYYDSHSKIAGKTSSRLGAFINHRHWSDAGALLPDELRELADPTHLQFCDVVAEAIQNSGYDPFQLPDPKVAVYVGHDSPSTNFGDDALINYADELGQELQDLLRADVSNAYPAADIAQELKNRLFNRFARTGLATSAGRTSEIAGLTSRAFNLSGPSQGINSACAASLHSVGLAVRSLQSGDVSMAIAGGASIWQPDTATEFSKAGAHSATGSRPFDDGADGVICTEGYGAVILKPLNKAIADGNRIWGVISGVGAASDGRGKGIWAPQTTGQKLAIRRAYASPEKLASVQLVEAHATSTPLGDATELKALSEVFGEAFPSGKKIPVTSVKANIGHTLEAAGIAGLIKTVLSIQKTEIPEQINIQTPNSRLDWDESPLYIPTRRTPWPSPGNGHARVAGVNAFGFGGYNMHVAVEEYIGSPVTQIPVGVDVGSMQESLPNPSKKEIAVVGRGCLLPSAENMEQLLRDRNQNEGPNWPNEVAPGNLDHFQYDWRRHKIPPKQLEQEDPLHYFLLEAVDQALADSGLMESGIDLERVGTLVASEMGGDFTDQLQIGLRLPEISRELASILQSHGISAADGETICNEYQEKCLHRWPQVADSTGSFHHSSLASRIVRSLDLNGPMCVIDNASCSTSSLVESACELLWSGDCDVVICVAGWRHRGAESLASSTSEQRFSQPLLEGATALVLKRHADVVLGDQKVHHVITKSSLKDTSTSTMPPSLEGKFEVSPNSVFHSIMRYLKDVPVPTTKTL
ncbi:Phthiocerol/phenolphthiocerol synthesis polyketide synthase type I PpsA [Polystyrenella longa]|uniref:Phthiocerol/phenolphthiocerol synthesis polyketide synthase type I PpsA n=1 Tax=Polystyrenella longa TaxID=2528007 RepID=A0A518CTJ8_9PLAN|nr:beta-ketoacyl synthase N-terminal-like domain-containing protein [Polystyrenella longa]QDU82543.1 Phthiocerol/phenolphthiocerol synthesis polyketide synthase type I PpsA [Polystyrenella longa]